MVGRFPSEPVVLMGARSERRGNCSWGTSWCCCWGWIRIRRIDDLIVTAQTTAERFELSGDPNLGRLCEYSCRPESSAAA